MRSGGRTSGQRPTAAKCPPSNHSPQPAVAHPQTVAEKTTVLMRRLLPLFFYVSGFALAGHAWLSAILPIPTKVKLSIAALLLVATGAVIQWCWKPKEE